MKCRPDIRQVREWCVILAAGMLITGLLAKLCRSGDSLTGQWVFVVLACLFGAAELFVELRYNKCPHCGEFPGRHGNHCQHCGGLLFEEEDDGWKT